SVLAVGIGKFSAADERNAQGLKVIGSHVIELGQGAAIAGSFILALGKHSAAKATTQGEIGCNGRGLDTWNRPGTIYSRAKILLSPAFLVMQSSQIESKNKEFLGLEARIDALRALHAANEQTRADKRDKCQGNFGYDQ